MAAQEGKDLLLKIATSDGNNPTYATVGGLRARNISFNAAAIDITNASSTDAWREILSDAGVKSASISGAGVFRDDTADSNLRQIFFSGKIRKWQILIPDFGTVTGKFHLSALEYAGEHDGEMTYQIALESAGALTFAAL